MKKTILYLLTLSILATSCIDKVEDISPVDQLDAENVFSSVADLEAGMSGVYSTYDHRNIIRHSSIFGDDTRIGADNGGQGVTLHNWIVDPGSNSAAMWNNCYQVINRANRILEAAEGITPEADEQDRYNVVLGEARAWRAYAHMLLMSVYSANYEPGTLAVPYVKDVIIFEQPARNTVAEVIAEIKADLSEAESLLPGAGDNTRFNDDILNAMRARLALYEGDNATALSLAQNLLASYPLANQADYRDIFTDTGDAENIWKLVKTQNDERAGSIWYFTGTGGAFFEMSRGVYEFMDQNDVRFEVNVDTDNTDDANDLLLIGKYLGKDGIAYLNDFKMFRAGEMQLIVAEARAKNDDFAGAAAAIDELRDLRFGSDQPTPSYTNLAQAMEDILIERRSELAYEGFRYIDLKRTRTITTNGMNRDDRDCGGGTPCDLDVADRRWTIPIPQAEVDANANMVQTAGYN